LLIRLFEKLINCLIKHRFELKNSCEPPIYKLFLSFKLIVIKDVNKWKKTPLHYEYYTIFSKLSIQDIVFKTYFFPHLSNSFSTSFFTDLSNWI
jgi:hypothetical protein